jgi:hypothetical protein
VAEPNGEVGGEESGESTSGALSSTMLKLSGITRAERHADRTQRRGRSALVANSIDEPDPAPRQNHERAPGARARARRRAGIF